MKMFFALMVVLGVAAGTAEAQPRNNQPRPPVVVVRPQVNNYYVFPTYPRPTYPVWVNPYAPRYNPYPAYGFGYSFGYYQYRGFGFWK